MPQRHTIRHYSEGSYYHIYNRGVEKRLLFKEPADYWYFVSLLESYLTSKKPVGEMSVKESKAKHLPYWRKLLEKDEVELVCYCLMSNHFHLLLKQNKKDAITRFMKRVSNAYVRYFNNKYERVGALFQGKFKAVLIENDSYLLHLSRYIHLNPSEVRPLNEYQFSSYFEYLKKRETFWVHKDVIMTFFDKDRKEASKLTPSLNIDGQTGLSSYKHFVEDYKNLSEAKIGDLLLE